MNCSEGRELALGTSTCILLAFNDCNTTMTAVVRSASLSKYLKASILRSLCEIRPGREGELTQFYHSTSGSLVCTFGRDFHLSHHSNYRSARALGVRDCLVSSTVFV